MEFAKCNKMADLQISNVEFPRSFISWPLLALLNLSLPLCNSRKCHECYPYTSQRHACVAPIPTFKLIALYANRLIHAFEISSLVSSQWLVHFSFMKVQSWIDHRITGVIHNNPKYTWQFCPHVGPTPVEAVLSCSWWGPSAKFPPQINL